MRELEPEFELFDIAHVSVAGWNRGMQRGSKLPGWGSAPKYENSGNEAKKYLKTKDITFLNGAIRACFACK